MINNLRGKFEGDMVNAQAIDFLISNQNQDGGWGYAPQQSSALEPTSAVLLAIKENSNAAQSRARAFDWLRRAQHADGGWGFSSTDKESAWQTAWAVLALSRSGEAADIIRKGVEWLLSVKTLQFGEDVIQAAKKIVAIDFSLRGWPWHPGEATWVEPTALSMLALESVPAISGAKERMNEAIRYLEDRRCPAGGWNVGNPIMFNSVMPARVHPTAWVLLALSGLAPESIHAEDIKILRSDMHQTGSALGLAWGLLALRTIREEDTLAELRLAALQEQNGGWANSPYNTAIALIASRGHL